MPSEPPHPLPRASRRVARVLAERGHGGSIRVLEDSARTAAQAAAALGVEQRQIVKSLVFRGARSGAPVLALVGGASRVEPALLEAHLGEPVERAQPDWVRERTGFAIGGIPPLGHSEPLRTVADAALVALGELWAAAGTPHSVFPLRGAELAALTGAEIASIAAPEAAAPPRGPAIAAPEAAAPPRGPAIAAPEAAAPPLGPAIAAPEAAAPPLGPAIDFSAAPRPPRTPMRGEHVELRPPDPDADAAPLYALAHPPGGDPSIWTYLSDGPFASVEAFRDALATWERLEDPLHFTIVGRGGGGPLGMASFMRIAPGDGVIEIGRIWFGRQLARTTAATEAIHLLARRAFDELGYRRLEWKCDALNAPSRRAAERFGFTFEGVFRRHMVVKGRSRDTAWFAITDADWPAISRGFGSWLAPSNFDERGVQRTRLAAQIRAARGGAPAGADRAGAVRVEEAREPSPALAAAVAALVGELSSSAAPPSAERLAEIVAAPACRLLLARDDEDRVLGMLTLVAFPIPTGVRAWIEDVVVTADARGRGVGELLNRAALRLAGELGARTVELTSRPSRGAANRLYARLGFERRDTNVYRHDDPSSA